MKVAHLWAVLCSSSRQLKISNFHIFALLKHYYLAVCAQCTKNEMRLFPVIFRQCVIYSLIDDCMLSGRKAQQEVVCSVTTAG